MSDHNQEIVVSKTEGSASSDNTNPWDDLSDQFNKGDGSAPVDADLDRVSESMEKRGAYVNQELLAHLKVAKREIIRLGWQGDPSQLILYPGSNSDRTMTEVFGNKVVHIDPDGNALALLKNKGFPTEQMTIEDYIANMSDREKIGMILSYIMQVWYLIRRWNACRRAVLYWQITGMVQRIICTIREDLS